MNASHPSSGPGPVCPDPDRPTPHTANSPAAIEPSQPEPDPAGRLAYSIDEAARLTGLSRDLLKDEMRRGHLTSIKVGRRRLISRRQLQQFLGDTSP